VTYQAISENIASKKFVKARNITALAIVAPEI
jgi:hypothetical protein